MGVLKWFWRHKIISIILIALIGFGIWWFFIKNGHEELDVSKIQRGDVVEELVLSGEVVADEHAYLKYPASGKISYVGVKEGETVYAGQLLGKMDTTVLNSSLQRAKADLRAAEANVDEVHDDLKDNDDDETFAEKNTRTAAEVAKDKAYESYVSAEYNLRNSNIYAPFEGMIIDVAYPYPGVNFIATETMFEILNPETMYFSVSADQTEVDDITVGDKVRIVLDSATEQELTGVVSFISFAPTVGEIGSVYSIKVALDGLSEGSFDYRVGMTGDAYFELSRAKNVLYAPSTFVQSSDGRDYVLTEEGKKQLDVEVGLEGEEYIEIKGNDIKEGLEIYD